jgi:alkylmercury lyase-like protein
MTAELDNRVRVALYERFVDEGEAPSVHHVAEMLSLPVEDVDAAFRRLAENRVIVLMAGTTEIWMAPPLSAVPTSFRVETPRGAFWGNCIWDGLGTVAMLGGEGTVQTRCPDCEEPLELAVENGALADGDGVAHFAVPAARWWDNIGFT